MARLNKRILAQIKEQISIIDIADEFGLTVVPKSRGTFSLKEHDSVLIYPKTNSFYRYATAVGGDVLKFMEEIPEISQTFQEAYDLLSKRIDDKREVECVSQKGKEKNKYEIHKTSLADKQKRARKISEQFNFDNNCKNAMAYLIQTRKIDPEIVKKLIHENCIKQETTILYKHKITDNVVTKKPYWSELSSYNQIKTKSVVFIGHDEMGLVASACKRACNSNSTFKGEYSGTDYSYGWLHDPDVISCNAYLDSQNYNPKKRLLCFESYIDMISFMTMLKQQGSDYRQYAYLSCGSATKFATALSVQERIGYKNVTICFDNDEAGQLFTGKLKSKLEEKGVNVNLCVSKQKDWNSELIAKTKFKAKKELGSNFNDIFNADTQVIVNPVNLNGTMEADLSLQFKNRFPNMFKDYQEKCKNGIFKEGGLLLYKENNYWILNFPTKINWKDKSNIELIDKGMNYLAQNYDKIGIKSIAFPKLGCDLGELDWENDVEPVFHKYLDSTKLKVKVCGENYQKIGVKQQIKQVQSQEKTEKKLQETKSARKEMSR